jgi:hypothetical protein
MIVVAVVDGADEGVAVGSAGEAGQVFGDGDARHAGGDGLELAADLLGRVGFEVPDIEVGRSAVVEEEDAGSGPAERAGLRSLARGGPAGGRGTGM